MGRIAQASIIIGYASMVVKMISPSLHMVLIAVPTTLGFIQRRTGMGPSMKYSTPAMGSLSARGGAIGVPHHAGVTFTLARESGSNSLWRQCAFAGYS